MIENFCKYCILQGAEIFPLNINYTDSQKLGICNPSIFDDNGTIYVSLRNVNYMLYQNLNKKYQTAFGELLYCIPDKEQRLVTRNFLANYNLQTNTIDEYKLIDTTKLDKEPVWDFVGHEDIRIVKWDNKFYVTGCRRDVKPDGESRMELSEINPYTGEELNRLRIKAPGNDTSYCEKNWMPILDMPFHYVKWTNPTEIVKVDPITGDCTSLFVKEQNGQVVNTFRALRGSSQVIPYKNGYICLTHEVDLYLNELKRKECQYYMKWVVFDKDFNIIKTSNEFQFLNFSIEFTNGLMHKDGIFYIPFSIMDNITFMLKVPDYVVDNFIDSKNLNTYIESYENIIQENNIYKQICLDNHNPEIWYNLGEKLMGQKQYTQASVCYAHTLEENIKSIDELYKYVYSLAKAFSGIGYRDTIELSFWQNCINVDNSRSEAYVNLARFYRWRGDNYSAYTFSKLAYEFNNYKKTTSYADVSALDGEILYYEMMYYCNDKSEAELNLINLKNYLNNKNNAYFNFYLDKVNSVLAKINKNKEEYKKII